MKILFAGGGTLGPVTPLLAVAEVLCATDASVRIIWVGTPHGPERALVEAAGYPFFSVPVARIPRYPSYEWLLLPWRILMACTGAWQILRRERPDIIGTAGGFTGVPLVIMGRLLGIPSWIHQPDVRPVLSNVITAPFAKWITVAWELTRSSFSARKTEVTGNPIRPSLFHGDRARALAHFGFSGTRPIVLVMGGGGGSAWINQTITALDPRLSERANVIHVTGHEQANDTLSRSSYATVGLLNGADMADAYTAASIVIARAGMGTLGELSALHKPVILVPLPHSPQEANAAAAKMAEAAVVVNQGRGVKELWTAVSELLSDKEKQRDLSKRIGTLLPVDAATRIAERLLSGL